VRKLSDGLTVSLVIVGPTFLFAELWRGTPIIDQAGQAWLIPAAIMAIGLFAGGLVAGRRRLTERALKQGILVGTLTVALIFIVDMVRRLTQGQGIPLGVFGLWVAAAATAMVVSGLGGLLGRQKVLAGGAVSSGAAAHEGEHQEAERNESQPTDDHRHDVGPSEGQGGRRGG
jgi:hypothetical protein